MAASFAQRKTTQAESCALPVVAWTKWPPSRGTLVDGIAEHGLGAPHEKRETLAATPRSCPLGVEMVADHRVALGTAASPTPTAARMGSEAAERSPGGELDGEVPRATGSVVGIIGSGCGQVEGIVSIV